MRAQSPFTFIALALISVGKTWSVIHFHNFSDTSNLSFVGDARVSGERLRLTTAAEERSGAVWLREKEPLASGFETNFEFQLTNQGGLGKGADGFAFVLQNSGPAALGGRGSAAGFAIADPSHKDRKAVIPLSIAVFFDTHRNRRERDPSDNYIAFCTYGKPKGLRWPAQRLAVTRNLSVYLKDGERHAASIRYRPPVLSVFLDNSDIPALESVVDVSPVIDGEGKAWVGFTASTGAGYEDHDILNWSFISSDVSSSISVVSSRITFLMSACLPDRKLCTPEHASVERSNTGYHVILPGNLAWGARVPVTRGQTVTVANAHGIICWDLNARAPSGCSGPSGAGTPAGKGFLEPNSSAGALITKTAKGNTSFSVNAPKNRFKNNEGFYEFDVQMK